MPPRRRGAVPKRARDSRDQPLVINGWSLYVWTELAERWAALRADAERTYAALGPERYRESAAAKMLAMVAALMFKEVPVDPGGPEYRQGTTLGPAYRHWRRAKFFRRFRLFFRYHSARKIIIYVWLNDEMTLRKAGARTDVYAVFHGMLSRGQPPNEFGALLRECRQLREGEQPGV